MKKTATLPDLTKQNIIVADYEDEMKQSYIDYAMSVIAARALPDIRDGLKPVQRRTLYAMKDLNLMPDKAYRKSARIVGDTMGKYHPHGDGSIYDSMVRMAQDFALKQLLVDGHGNFGSIDGDGSAAMRYTEARLKPLTLELLGDIEKNVVPMKTNFDETLIEPMVMPARFPNALVNGMTGIAVGMATSFPTHNLKEITDGTVAYIKNPDITIRELMKYIKGPDFPTGGIIANKSELEDIYTTGKGRIKIRGKIDIEQVNNDKYNIIIREIPYTMIGNKSKFIENIAELIKNKKINSINDIRDESSRGEIEIIIETKKGVDPQKVLGQLYKKTKLEDYFSVNMLALLNQKPYLFNLKTAIEEFVIFQRDIYTKRYKHLLNKELDKKETTEGLLRAYDEIDIIIETIRGAKNAKVVKKCLVTGETTDIKYKTKLSETLAHKFHYTERQATVILEMRLYKLIGLEKIEVEKQHIEILRKIKRYEKILNNEKELDKTIIEVLEDIGTRFGEDRKTQLRDLETFIIEEEKVIENLYILIDNKNYAKTIDEITYERNAEKINQEMEYVIPIKTGEFLHIFDTEGYLHQIKVEDIPRTKLNDKGSPIAVLAEVKEDSIMKIGKMFEDKNYLFITQMGYVKYVNGAEFISNRSKLVGTRLIMGDSLLKIIEKSNKEELITITTDGYVLIIKAEEIPQMKRNAKGVSLIKMEKKDTIVDVSYLEKNQKTIQIQVDEAIQKKNLSAIPRRKRNSKGKQIYKNKNIVEIKTGEY